jgi:GTP-binding protein
MARPVVSLVGRPNVGKSRLFNRLLGRRKALVQDTPGVTRDRNYALAELGGCELILCDTGGFEERGAVADDVMARLIREQALVAIEESDVLVFVMDLKEGLTAGDEEIAQRLRGVSQPVIWVLNKADHPSTDELSADFYRLGVDGFVLVSAEHGRGGDDLLDAIVDALPAVGEERGVVDDPAFDERKPKKRGGRLQFLGDDMLEGRTTGRGPSPQEWDPRPAPPVDDAEALHAGLVLDDDGVEVHYVGGSFGPDGDFDGEAGEGELPPDFEAVESDDFVPRIAILGRPNVGKSTLLNRLLGFQRSITSPVAGTTHDTVDAWLEHDGQGYVLIDTAGVRRKSRVDTGVEALTVGRTLRTVEAAHVCLLVVDASEGVTDQEAKLGSLIVRRGRSLILVINKLDLMPRGGRQELLDQIRRRFPHMAFADALFLSAKTGRGVGRLWDALERANEGHRLTIGTGQLNRWARGVWAHTPPPMHKHRPVRLYYCAQVGVRPPTFVFFCNQPKALPDSYQRYLGNQLRAAFPAPGSPLRLLFRDRGGS